MTAASNSESRKRRTVAADPVEIVDIAVAAHKRSAVYLDYCICGAFTRKAHGNHLSAAIVAALKAAGLLTPP